MNDHGSDDEDTPPHRYESTKKVSFEPMPESHPKVHNESFARAQAGLRFADPQTGGMRGKFALFRGKRGGGGGGPWRPRVPATRRRRVSEDHPNVMRRVSTLLWSNRNFPQSDPSVAADGNPPVATAPSLRRVDDSGAVGIKFSVAAFDPDNVVRANEADKAMNGPKRRSTIRKICLVLMAVGLTLLGAGLVTLLVLTNKRNLSSQAGVQANETASKYDVNPAITCSKEKIQETYGYSSCEELCITARCCFLPEWANHSCTGKNGDMCRPFLEHCVNLDTETKTVSADWSSASNTKEEANPILTGQTDLENIDLKLSGVDDGVDIAPDEVQTLSNLVEGTLDGEEFLALQHDKVKNACNFWLSPPTHACERICAPFLCCFLDGPDSCMEDHSNGVCDTYRPCAVLNLSREGIDKMEDSDIEIKDFWSISGNEGGVGEKNDITTFWRIERHSENSLVPGQ